MSSLRDDPGETFEFRREGEYATVTVRFRHEGGDGVPDTKMAGISAREEFVGFCVSMAAGFVPALEPALVEWLRGYAEYCAARRTRARGQH